MEEGELPEFILSLWGRPVRLVRTEIRSCEPSFLMECTGVNCL